MTVRSLTHIVRRISVQPWFFLRSAKGAGGVWGRRQGAKRTVVVVTQPATGCGNFMTCCCCHLAPPRPQRKETIQNHHTALLSETPHEGLPLQNLYHLPAAHHDITSYLLSSTERIESTTNDCKGASCRAFRSILPKSQQPNRPTFERFDILVKRGLLSLLLFSVSLILTFKFVRRR